MKKYLKTPEFITAVCFFFFLAVGIFSNISVENVRFVQNEKSESVSLPFLRNIDIDKPFDMEFDVVSPFNFSYNMWLVPDDCADKIAVGDEVINLSKFKDHCNFSNGFMLADSVIAPYRQSGKTHYVVTLRNKGGPGGFMFFVKMNSIAGYAINILAFVSLALFVAFVARRLRLGKTLVLLLFVGILFRCIFFMAISYKTFSMDVEGHIAYVEYILENHSVPDGKECWSCYHPPVYYIAAAPSYAISEFLGFPGTTGLQCFSLLLSILTVFFGLLFLRKILEGRSLILASALWIFWPLLILVAPRIGNDQMFYLLHVLCMWAGINYVKDGHGKYLITALVAAALALWTKSTGVVTLGMFFVFMMSGILTHSRLLQKSRPECVAWTMFVVIVVAFFLQRTMGPELVGNANALNSAMRVQNGAPNYLFFDLRNFLESPYTSCWKSSMGREFFWNFVLKTSLFGEWSLLPTAVGRLLATMISVFLLGLVVYAIRAFWKIRLGVVHWILLLQGIVFIAALMALRMKYPYACSNDFRYIVPVLLSFCPFVAMGITLKDSSTKWRVIGYALVPAFIVSSAVLYIMVM